MESVVLIAVVTFVNTTLHESVDGVDQRERHIVSQFRNLRGGTDVPSSDLAYAISIELRVQLGLGIEIIELRERDSVRFISFQAINLLAHNNTNACLKYDST